MVRSDTAFRELDDGTQLVEGILRVDLHCRKETGSDRISEQTGRGA